MSDSAKAFEYNQSLFNLYQYSLFALFFGISGGIISAEYILVGWIFGITLIVLLAWAVYSKRLIVKHAIAILLILIVSFSIGYMKSESKLATITTAEFEAKKNVELVGIVSELPAEKATGTELILDHVLIDGTSLQDKKVILRLDYTSAQYGDKITTHANITPPKVIIDDTGRKFDYPKYLAFQGITTILKAKNIEKTESGFGNSLQTFLFKLQQGSIQRIQSLIPQPESLIATGVIIGGSGSLSKTISDQFRVAGLSHIIVLSGYNISIVGIALMVVLAYFGGLVSIIGSILGIILFILFVGGGASIIRAGIMGILFLFAKYFGQKSSALRMLLLAGICMALFDPTVLLHNVSFELSFLATLGLVLLMPLFERVVPKFKKHGNFFREIALATLSAQIMVIPLILYVMGSVSLISFISNIVVVPLVPFIMALSAGALVFSFARIGFVIAPLLYVSIHIMLKLIEFFASLPYASVSIREFPLWGMFVLYGIIFAVVFPTKKALNRH